MGLLMKAGPWQPTDYKYYRNLIGMMPVLDEMHIELDVEIHSFLNEYTSVFSCQRDDDRYKFYPGMWIHGGKRSQGFWFGFTTEKGSNDGTPWTGSPLVVGEKYHVEMDITQGTRRVSVNGELMVDEEVARHPTWDTVRCWSGDKYHDPAAVTVSNFLITGRKPVTSDSVALPMPYSPLDVDTPIDWSYWYQLHRDQLIVVLGASLVILCCVGVAMVMCKGRGQRSRYEAVKWQDVDTESDVDVEKEPIKK